VARRRVQLLVAMLVASALPATAAHAATEVTIGSCGTADDCIQITAHDGGADLVVETTDSAIDIREAIFPGNGVSVDDPPEPTSRCHDLGSRIRCPLRPWVRFSGSGQDDRLDASGLDARTALIADGGGGDDSITGGDGDDRFSAGDDPDGADVYAGGAGADLLTYSGRTEPVTLTQDGVANDGAAGESDDVGDDIETIVGGEGDDTLAGPAVSAVARTLDGSSGDDVLIGSGGPDRLVGGQGEDILQGGEGDDVLDASDPDWSDAVADAVSGGPGSDTVVYDEAAPGGSYDIHVSPGAGADDGRAGEGDDVAGDVEHVVTARGNDTIVGTAAANDIDSGAGDDVVTGGGGPDVVDAGPGADELRMRDGLADRVRCGDGADTLVGDDTDDATGCETTDLVPAVATVREIVTVPGPPAPPAGAPETGIAPPRSSGPAADRRAPRLRLTGLPSRMRRATLLRRGLRPTARADEAVRLSARLVGRVRGARAAAAGDLVLAERRGARPARTHRLSLRVARRLHGALRGARSVVVEVTASDAAGNTRTVRRTVRLR